MTTFVGIDLGTTNSVVACRNAYGRPEVIANREGQNVTPSVIYFGTNPPVVGQEAKEYARLGDDQVASFFKPHMGSPLYRLQFGGRDYSATDLSAVVLRSLKDSAEAKLGVGVDRAVITVPAYFADAQRKATIEAGRLAGLEVLRIINEPTAAALAYGLQKTGVTEDVLIYDLGGGTFDVTVARISPDEIAVLSTAGDHDLGGKNWDDRIATYLAEKFASARGSTPLDDPMAVKRGAGPKRAGEVGPVGPDVHPRDAPDWTRCVQAYEVTRTEFEGMTFALTDRTRRLTEEGCSGRRISRWKTLGGVLLVGGSTRMPMVRQYVGQMAGQPPRAGVNVDEVVALGAAIQAAMDAGLATDSAAPKFTLAGARRVSDVMSHSLGAVAVSPEGSMYVNDVIIRRNFPIPAQAKTTYLHETHGGANQTLEIYLTQGESERPLDCSILGRYVFSGIQPTDREVSVDVALSYDANGVVQVGATQRDTGHALALTVQPVPDDLSWLGLPPKSATTEATADPARIYLLIDGSASMAGTPLMEAQQAARAFLDRCDFTAVEVGLIAFSDQVVLQCEVHVERPARIQAAIVRLEADGTTNLSDALAMARDQLSVRDRKRLRGDPDRRLSRIRPRRPSSRGRSSHRRGDRDRRHRDGCRRRGVSAPPGEHRGRLDLRPTGRAGRRLRPHRQDDRPGRAIAEEAMSAATEAIAPIIPFGTRAIRAFQRGSDLALAGAIGAVFGLYFFVELVQTDDLSRRDALAGALIGGSIGFMLNAAEAFREGAWRKLSRTASWGALAGSAGGAIGLLVGEFVLTRFQGGLIGRAVSWSILGLGIGVSQGLAYRSTQRLRFGLIGGGIGGFAGGLLYEALRVRLGNRYDLSQAIGMVILGGGLGLCLALVERVLGRVWVQVMNGRQEGRSYLLASRRSTLGLDERADVGLFGDPTVDRNHAEIAPDGSGFVLVARDGQGRTKLNGVTVAKSSPLADGDRIELGGTVLVFRKR